AFPLIGWLALLERMPSGPNVQVAVPGELLFYGIPLPPTTLWATLELAFAAFLLSAVVRNIKRELEAMQLFSIGQGIGFALYCNFVWIGFYPWRSNSNIALGLLLLWCVLIFYVIGIGVLQTRDRIRRELRELRTIGSAPPKLLMPIFSILIAAFLTSLVV